MRRLLGSKNSSNAASSSGKGKQRQGGVPTTTATTPSQPDPSLTQTTMEVHVSTQVHSAQAHGLHGFHPLESTSTLAPSPSPSSTNSQPLPPEIRVPTHPYPYWHGAHTPSSSQSSLESPMTPSHVSWLSANTPANGNSSNGSSTNLSLNYPASAPPSPPGPSSSTHSLINGRSTPNPHFPPPPATNPPPALVPRPKLLHPTKSTHSLRIPVQELFNQQLSPIVEQDYLSPEKRPLSLPSSSHDGAGSRSSTAQTARTSAALMTPISPGSDGAATSTMTPVSPVPITPVLVGARGTPPTPQTQTHTPVTPSFTASVVPFARRKDEEGSDSPRPSPVLTFLSRPLNRSISLSSTRTHQSSVSSAAPPVIPPLDLRPEFRGQVFMTTPTSLHSRGFLDVGAVGAYDDDSASDRRESFVTALTGAGRESKYSVGQEDTFVDAEENIRRDSDETIHPCDTHVVKDDTPPTPHTHPLPHDTSKPHKPPIPAKTGAHARSPSHTSSLPPYNYPPGPHSSDNHLYLGYHPHRSTPSPNPPPRMGVSAPSLQDLGTSISTSSSFIDRRFAPSSLYLATPREREFARTTGEKWTIRKERMDTVQVLFWIGFIAPWCWLIGGWLVTSKPASRGASYGDTYHNGIGGGSSLLPLWTSKTKSMQSFDTTKMQHGYPFVAPSVLSLTPPPYTRAVSLTPKPVREVKNPWVRRCRIAAVVSGMLIVIAFIAALVVVGVGHM